MSNIDSLLSQLKRLKPSQQDAIVPILQRDEMQRIIQFELDFLQSYPDEIGDFTRDLKKAEDYDRVWALRMQRRSIFKKAKWIDSEEGHTHTLICMIGNSLGMDVRVKLAEALGQLEEADNEQH